MVKHVAAAFILVGSLVALSCQAGAPPPSGDQQPKPSDSTSPTPPRAGGPSAQPTPSGPGGTPAQPTLPGATSTPAQVTPIANKEHQDAAELAGRQLSADKGIPAGQIQVVRVELVEWRDSSLGCPEPGMMYAQVITPGYRVILTAQGVTYEYHTQGTRRAVLCKQS